MSTHHPKLPTTVRGSIRLPLIVLGSLTLMAGACHGPKVGVGVQDDGTGGTGAMGGAPGGEGGAGAGGAAGGSPATGGAAGASDTGGAGGGDSSGTGGTGAGGAIGTGGVIGAGGAGPGGAGAGGAIGTGGMGTGGRGTGGAVGTGGTGTGGTGTGGRGTGGAIGTGGVSGTGGGPPPGWMVTGALYPGAEGARVMIDGLGNATLLIWHFGGLYSRGLAHGASAWTPAQVQSLFICGCGTSTRAQMNAAGVGAIAWAESTTVTVQRYVGGQWEAQPKYFSANQATTINALEISPTGTIHLLYNSSVLAFATPTGTWTTPTGGNQLGLAADHVMAFDPKGNGFLVSRGVQASLFNATAASWAPPQVVSTETTSNGPIVAADDGGGAVAVWTRGTNLAAYRYPRSSWTALPIIVPLVSGTIQDLSMVGDGSNFFVTWVQQSGSMFNLYAVRGDGTTWGLVKLISDGSHSIPYQYQPQIGADAAGNVTVVWLQGTSASKLDVMMARYQSATGSWAPPLALSAAPDAIAEVPSLAVSADGVTAVVWRVGGNVTAAVSQ